MIGILVFTPYLDKVEPRTIEALTRLEWEGSLSLLLQRDNPYGEDRVRNHLHQYQRGREAFLASSADAMLIVEADILPPADALVRLAALEADVGYGCTVFRAKGSSHIVNILERYGGQARNTGESLTVRGLWPEAVKAGIVECSGSGLACLLVRRHVIEAVPFRMPENGYCDTAWTEDVYRQGFSMKADTRVLCGHIDQDGTVLWPELPA